MADQDPQSAGSSASLPSSTITAPEPTTSPCWESGDDWRLSSLHHTNSANPTDKVGTSAQVKDDQPYTLDAPYTTEGEKYDQLEKSVDSNTGKISDFEKKVSRLGQLQNKLDDQENHSRRNNIRIKVLPESIGQQELFVTLCKLFNSMLGKPPDSHIVIDRAHCELRPSYPNSDIPCDIICRIHFYNVKGALMLKARDSEVIHFESMQLKFFQDLSRNTLRQRHAQLEEHSIKYRWGFPFALIVIRQGKSILIKTHKDIPHFLKALNLPPVAIENWEMMTWELPQPKPDRNTTSTSTRHSNDAKLTSGHSAPPKRRILET
ncbi:hypothetical protein XELAEV_18019156mg [Xenopus laevis]|uniref:Uncharacterized protein n=1 Tax=Xenopus laevis TaxID=8355 RepID=A0A974HUL0_XENLA|nr:hypothetical protein XELAEV_18019156mg [Xenopus laevis]